MIKIISCIALLAALCIPVAAEKQSKPPFKDVPPNHWAADAVKKMSDSGIIVGYPDAKFKGDKAVTRYELVITLDRFVHFVEAGRAPLVKDQKKSTPQKPSPAAPKAESSKSETVDGQAKASLSFLVSGGFLPKDSLLTKDGKKPIDTELLARTLTSVVSRLVVMEADRQKHAESPLSTQPQP